MRVFIPALAMSTGLVFVACGGGSSGADKMLVVSNDDAGSVRVVVDAGPPDAGDNGAPSEVYPAPHPEPPQLVSDGGDILAAAKLIPITFAGDPLVTQIEDFVKSVGATPYWLANVKEYGAGPATSGTPIHLTETPAAMLSDAEVQAWLASKLDGTHPEFGTPDANTLYTIYYPAATTITLGGGGGQGASQSCQAFGGYHSNIELPNKQLVAYAVVPRCATFGRLTGLDVVTGTSSHEFVEAATDAHPQALRAFGGVDDNHAVWEYVIGGGENGDLCAQNAGAFYKPDGYVYTVQRAWSNASAKAGHDPCVPSLPNEIYFNSAPVLPDDVRLGGAQGVTTKGVLIAEGATRTIELDLFSDAKTTGAWTVSARDSATLRGQPPRLSFAFDRNTGVNGEKLHLTITVLKASPFKAEGFLIVSKLSGQTNLWVGLVGN